MSRKDTVTKDYFSDSRYFADIVNYFVYDGKKVVAPEALKPLDSTELALPSGKESTKVKAVQKHRDVLKYLSGMTDDNTAYVILGLELQSGVHNAMPVRNMLYDAMEYTRQVEDIARKHKKEGYKPDDSDEYLSGIRKDDKLKPVVTIVIYFGADEWDAPESIYDMLDVKDPNILKYVTDYRINLITPAKMDDEDFEKFATELKQVFKYLKYSKDKEKLNVVMREDEVYKHISRRTAVLLNTVAGMKMKINRRKDEVNMCKAIEDMLEDARNEGREEMCKGIADMLEDARNEVREEMCKGIADMLEDARNEGREEMSKKVESVKNEERFDTLSALVKKGIISISQAAEEAGMSVSEFEAKYSAKKL